MKYYKIYKYEDEITIPSSYHFWFGNLPLEVILWKISFLIIGINYFHTYLLPISCQVMSKTNDASIQYSDILVLYLVLEILQR